VVVRQGEVWWADLDSPFGSEPGYRRPVVIVQGDALNQSQIATVICVPLTTNLRLATAPGMVLVRRVDSGLPDDSIANVTQILTLDRARLDLPVALLPRSVLMSVFRGIDTVFER
jgi:mRNA interferase MazF